MTRHNDMTYREMVDAIRKQSGWSEAFALEYAMERRYNQASHDEAFASAMRSVWVKDEDKPKVA